MNRRGLLRGLLGLCAAAAMGADRVLQLVGGPALTLRQDGWKTVIAESDGLLDLRAINVQQIIAEDMARKLAEAIDCELLHGAS